MRKIVLLLAVTLILTSCQERDETYYSTLSAKERAAVDALSWLKDADPQRDALAAIAHGDKRLLVMAIRGAGIPGIPAEQAASAKARCGIRYLAGSTDAILGKTHLRLLQAAQQYAIDYNRIMLNACLPKEQ